MSLVCKLTKTNANEAVSFPNLFYRRLRKNCEKLLLASSYLSVRPSVRMEQLSSHWTDFHENLLCEFFSKKKKNWGKIQV